MIDFDRPKLRAELEHDEGFVPHAYPDSRGYLTLGIGRLIDKRVGGKISRVEALFMLDNDIDAAASALTAIEPRWRELTPERQRVLLNMALNLGQAKLARFFDLWGAIAEYLDGGTEDALDRAADAMLDSDWARQVKGRATRLAALMRPVR